MSIFSKIFRNQNAKHLPRNINDFRSSINILTSRDPVAFSAIDKIATAFASLSIGVYDSKTKQKVKHQLYEVLKEPNIDETHSLFFYQLIQDYYAGNVYLYKYTDENDNVISLFRLNPQAVYVNRNEYNQKTYSYYGQVYTSDKVLHIPSRFGYDGKIGHSIFDECKKVFDTSTSLDYYTNNTFDNSLGKRLVIDLTNAYPNASEEEQKQIRDRYVQNYSGSQNAGKPVVKTSKIDFSTIDSGVSDNRAAQLSENRAFQLELISELFNVPVEYLTGKDVKDIESLTTLFVTQAIKPLTDAFQEAFMKLFPARDREKYYIEFDYNSLLKTSHSAKIESYTKQFNNGQLTLNEIRAKENLPPLEAGDYAFVPANLIPLTKDNVEAILAKSKLALQQKNESKSAIENAEHAETVPGLGSDKI